MNINAIIELIVKIVSIVGYILLAVLAIKRKKNTVQSTEQSEDAIDKLLDFIVSEIKDCEIKGQQISGKSGVFKFDWVVNHAKDYARELGLNVDNNYINERVEALVKLLNFNRDNLKSVQSSEHQIINAEVIESENGTNCNYIK